MLVWNSGKIIPEGGSKAPCLFCFKPCSKSPTSSLNVEIPGAVRSSKLECQLHHLFILRHLLEIPSSWCEQALERNDGRSHPDSWFGTCSECMKLVREGWCIYQKLLRCELEMKSIKARVRNVILESSQQERESQSGTGIDIEIRGFVLKDVEMLVCSPPVPDFKVEESRTPEKDLFLQDEIEDIPGERPQEGSPDDFTIESSEKSPSESSEIDSDEDFVPVPSIRKLDGRGRPPGRPKGSKSNPSLLQHRKYKGRKAFLQYQEGVKVVETVKKRRGRPKGSKSRSKFEENHAPATNTGQEHEPDLDDDEDDSHDQDFIRGKVSEAATNDQDVKYCPIATESKADIPEAISVLPTHFLDYDDEVQLPVLFDITYQESAKVAETGQKKKRGRPKGSKTRSKSEENQTSTTTTEPDFEPDLDDSQSNRNPESPEWNPHSLEFNTDHDVLYPDADEDSLSEEFDEDSSDEDFELTSTSSANPHRVKRTRGRPKGSKPNRSLLQRRKYKRRKESDWKLCALCSSKFKMQKYLDDHMEAHEQSKQNGGKFDCEICSFPGTSEENLMNHIASKHNNPQKMFSKKYSCSKCDFTTEVPATLKDHVKQEHSSVPDEEPEKNLVPTCSVCQRTFVTFRSMCVHERKMHPELYGIEEASIPCDKCELRFSSKLRLQYHINNTHLRVNKVICDICGKSSLNMKTLNRHKITHKKDSRQYVCDICGLDYSYKDSLTSHYRKCHSNSTNKEDSSGPPGSKTNEETHKCRYCGMGFPFKAVLLKHLQTHKASMGHQCDICKKYYSTDQGLKRHKSINHSGTSEQFNCKFCFKVFTSMNAVQDHIRNYCRIKRLVDKPPIPNAAVIESESNFVQTSSSGT